jgi:hypothetical protein
MADIWGQAPIADVPCPALEFYGLPAGFYVGLDLGQARDYSAIIVNEKRVAQDGTAFHAIRWAHRFRLGTNYLDVAREVADLMGRLPLRPEPPALWADNTGVGRPVSDLLREQGLTPWNVNLTAGANWSISGPKTISLPKAIMASTLNVALQNGDIGFAGDLPWLAIITSELGSYRVTQTASGADSFNSRTESDHDDFVVALGLAVFGASRNFQSSRTVMI